jgi:hypothetical protein
MPVETLALLVWSASTVTERDELPGRYVKVNSSNCSPIKQLTSVATSLVRGTVPLYRRSLCLVFHLSNLPLQLIKLNILKR